ncbi:MAG TPA: phospholipid carrier-dependent glycosyltransferase [Candidatus Koribacter sp.]|jgi:dolichyl-phosphate-mannose--protein O-mannosyl transferase
MEQRTAKSKIILTGAVLFFCTLVLLLFRVHHPDGPIFDESIYIDLARSYLHRTLAPLDTEPIAFGRQHPPMGMYLIATGMRIAGDNPLGWRLASVLAGSFTASAMFLWTWTLLSDYELALMAALLTLFNNFLYVMSRAAMLDGLMFAFAIWAVLAFTAAIQRETGITKRRCLIVACGLLFGLAGATKWNAVDCWAVVVAIAMLLWFTSDVRVREIGLRTLLLGLIAVPAVVYLVTFLPLFHAMQTTFSFDGLISLHKTMISMTKAAHGNPTQFAPWYTWPLRTQPMRAFSYLLGNPVVMWGGLVAVVICVARFAKRRALPEAMVAGLYAANLLQWVVTPLKVPNYYYYFSAAMFLAPMLAVALSDPAPRRIWRMRPALVLTIASFVVFLYCYPRMAHLDAPWDCMFGCWN